MPPNLITQMAEVKSYRMLISRGKSWLARLMFCCRVGPCDVTSKADLEKLIKEISSKEKYLNLLSRSPPSN